MIKRLAARTGAALLAATALLPAAQATEVFQNTSATLGYTNKAEEDPVFGTGTNSENASFLRLDHFGVHGFGDNYFFIDTFKGKGVGNLSALPGVGAGSFGVNADRQYQLVWNARASLSKITGEKLSFGVIDDISLFYRMERASYVDYTANMIGPSLNLKLPGFAWFQTSLLFNKQDYAFATSDFKKGHVFWHNFAILPFEVGGMKFTFAPLLWMNFSKEDSVGTELYIEPDLWVKLGNTPVDLGVRILYHRYKDYSRTSPTVMARWNF